MNRRTLSPQMISRTLFKQARPRPHQPTQTQMKRSPPLTPLSLHAEDAPSSETDESSYGTAHSAVAYTAVRSSPGPDRVTMAMIDTGATIHVTGNLKILRDWVKVDTGHVMGLGGRKRVTAIGKRVTSRPSAYCSRACATCPATSAR